MDHRIPREPAELEKLLKRLETQDKETYSHTRDSLRAALDCGFGIDLVVKHYLLHKTERSLDLLSTIREPYDTVLLGCLQSRFSTSDGVMSISILLGQIIQKGTSWVPKIAFHPLFKIILTYLQKDRGVRETPNDIALVLLLCHFLPFCSALNEKILSSIFYTFILTCAHLRKLKSVEKRNPEEEVNSSHFEYAIRHFFFTLYGIYPNNFIHYLRAYCDDGNEDRQRLYERIIRPMFGLTKLHPALIETSKDKEVDRTRWNQKEPHDFLDECRRMMVGYFPPLLENEGIGLMDDANASEEQSTDVGAMYQKLFPVEHSSNLSYNSDQDDDDRGDVELRNALMDMIDTPPGTRSATPMHKKSLEEPIVVNPSRNRRPSGADEGGRRKSIRQKIQSVFTRSMGNTEELRVPAENVTDRRSGEFEEAEEAVDLDMYYEEAPSTSRESTRMGEGEGADEAAAKIAFRQRSTSIPVLMNVALRRSTTGGGEEVPPQPSPLMKEEKQATVTDPKPLPQPQQQLQPAPAETVDAISASVPPSLSLAATLPSTSVSVGGTKDEEKTQKYIQQLIAQHNRQRFRSECPVNDEMKEEEGCVVETGAGRVLSSDHSHHMHAHHSMLHYNPLKRISSCPEMLRAHTSTPMMESVVEVKEGASIDILHTFPYLNLLPLSHAYLIKLEEHLELEHEIARQKYIEASNNFHLVLKRVNLADQLPGRIYDDMHHITKKMDVNSQRDLLQARLRLVNQHLLYERSCRLLHANRNRRLFGRMKQQKMLETELRSYREKESIWNREREEMIKNFSSAKIQKREATRRAEAERIGMKKAMDELLKRHEAAMASMRDCLFEKERAESEMKKAKGAVDNQKRRADDLQSQLSIVEKKLKCARVEAQRVIPLARENERLRDELAMYEKQRRDEMGRTSPEWTADDGRVRELEKELEKMRIDRDTLNVVVEEERQRRDDVENALKAETGRAQELKHRLDSAALSSLDELNATKEKFTSMQNVVKHMENYIQHLHVQLEEKEEDIRRRFHALSSGQMPARMFFHRDGDGDDELMGDHVDHRSEHSFESDSVASSLFYPSRSEERGAEEREGAAGRDGGEGYEEWISDQEKAHRERQL